MSRLPRVGVVGYGYGGKVFHATLVAACSGLELAAVCSRSEAKRRAAEADFGVRTYADYADMIRDPELDLISISTPNDLHAPFAIQAMEAGKHVVVDKPFALTADQVQEMIAVRDRCGVLLSPYQNSRFDSDFLTLQHCLAQGLLGDVILIEAAWQRYATTRSTFRAFKEHGGGPFYDFAPHFLDQALQLLGSNVDTVYADFLYTNPDYDIEWSAHCWLRFASGTRFSMEAGYISRLPKPRWFVRGTIGTFRKEHRDTQEQHMSRGRTGPQPDPPEEWATVATEVGGVPTEMRIETVTTKSYMTYYENIAEAITTGTELLVKPEEALETARVMDAAMQSAATGEVVRMGS